MSANSHGEAKVTLSKETLPAPKTCPSDSSITLGQVQLLSLFGSMHPQSKPHCYCLASFCSLELNQPNSQSLWSNSASAVLWVDGWVGFMCWKLSPQCGRKIPSSMSFPGSAQSCEEVELRTPTMKSVPLPCSLSTCVCMVTNCYIVFHLLSYTCKCYNCEHTTIIIIQTT
jgi:hypothetical protein